VVAWRAEPACGRIMSLLPSYPNFKAFYQVLIVLLSVVQLSWQQKDPLNDFCRRFGQRTTVIDRKLYIDGGLLDWNPISQNPGNYSSTIFFLSATLVLHSAAFVFVSLRLNSMCATALLLNVLT
jgi:hypothetical protein